MRPDACLGWIVPHVFLNFPLMLFAPENLVKRLVLPELTRAIQFRVYAIRSVKLPRVKNLGHSNPGLGVTIRCT